MRNQHSTVYIWMALLTLLAACAPQTTAVPTPSIVPVTWAGPQMTVASTTSYVDGTLLVAVPAGTFTMGAAGVDNPAHNVMLANFWIYSTKVTNQQFAACVSAGGCTIPDKKDNPTYDAAASANDPVIGVTYDQASAYCAYVHARLPTEAEWEKTARGPSGNIYPWGDAAPSCDLLNFNKCVGNTTNVITYPQGQSFYHALDMEGNAFEWVADRYDPAYYKSSPAQDPAGPDTGPYRSLRSSSYASKAGQVTPATRFFDLPASHRSDLGFRCVVDDPTYFAPFCETVAINGLNASPAHEDICPKHSIKVEPACLPGNVQGAIITIQPYPVLPPSHLVVDDSAGCVNPGGNKWQCPWPSGQGFAARFWCSYDLPGNFGCVTGYTYVDATKSCMPNAGTLGTSSACIAGYNYDPAKQCCSALAGTAGPYAPCLPGYGYVFNGSKYYCQQWAWLNIDHVTHGVCNVQPTPKGNKGPACEPQTCSQNYSWDPNQCTCVCDGC